MDCLQGTVTNVRPDDKGSTRGSFTVRLAAPANLWGALCDTAIGQLEDEVCYRQTRTSRSRSTRLNLLHGCAQNAS